MDLSQLTELFKNNDFLTGGALLGAAGVAVAALRSYPARIYGWAVRRLFMEFELRDNDPSFYWMLVWLSSNDYLDKRARYLSVGTSDRSSPYSNSRTAELIETLEDAGGRRKRKRKSPKIILSPAPGINWLWYGNKFLIVHRHRDDSVGGNAVKPEMLTIKVLWGSRSLIRELLMEAYAVAVPPEADLLSIYHPEDGYWSVSSTRKPRPLASVVLEEGVAEALVADLEKFLESSQWYEDRGLPHRRGYLFYGPPGNGKTTTVLAMASELGMDLAVLNLAGKFIGDKELINSMSRVPERSIVLIEDIDCVFEQRKATDDKDNSLTFSGLLNALDGVATSEGRVLVMTTNHPEKLDPALIRPGRCDVKVSLGNPNADQVYRIFLRFFPDQPMSAEDFTNAFDDDFPSMATVQGILIENSHDAGRAVEAALRRQGDKDGSHHTREVPEGTSPSGEVPPQQSVRL